LLRGCIYKVLEKVWGWPLRKICGALSGVVIWLVSVAKRSVGGRMRISNLFITP
jgi:hypothetical protein